MCWVVWQAAAQVTVELLYLPSPQLARKCYFSPLFGLYSASIPPVFVGGGGSGLSAAARPLGLQQLDLRRLSADGQKSSVFTAITCNGAHARRWEAAR